MTTDCKISCCEWIGKIDDLFTHVERNHKEQKKEIVIDKQYFQFTFNDFPCEPFLLDGNNGIYWFQAFCDEESIKFGIYHIGTSEVETYKIKFGLYAKTGLTEIYGPFQTKSEVSKSHDLEILNVDFERIGKFMSSDVRIYFMEDISEEDNEFLELTSNCVDWSKKENIDRNNYWIEKLTCSICTNYIRKDARFCENRHFLCKKCLEKLIYLSKVRCSQCDGLFENECSHNQKIKLLTCLECCRYIRKKDRFCENAHFLCKKCHERLRVEGKLKCPLCRGSFQYDNCSDEKIESLLKLLKFPGDEAIPPIEIISDPIFQKMDGNIDETVIEMNEVDDFIVITLNGKEIQRIPL